MAATEEERSVLQSASVLALPGSLWQVLRLDQVKPVDACCVLPCKLSVCIVSMLLNCLQRSAAMIQREVARQSVSRVP